MIATAGFGAAALAQAAAATATDGCARLAEARRAMVARFHAAPGHGHGHRHRHRHGLGLGLGLGLAGGLRGGTGRRPPAEDRFAGLPPGLPPGSNRPGRPGTLGASPRRSGVSVDVSGVIGRAWGRAAKSPGAGGAHG